MGKFLFLFSAKGAKRVVFNRVRGGHGPLIPSESTNSTVLTRTDLILTNMDLTDLILTSLQNSILF